MAKQPSAIAGLITVCAVCLAGQPRVAFDVTSVRANTSGQRQAAMRWTPAGDFTAINQPPRVLLNLAYRLPLFQVEGMPDWFTTERFDVVAKAPAGLKVEPLAVVRGQLLQSLLEDRFKLKARFLTKPAPAMILTLARDDGRLGPQLRKVDVDCAAAIAAIPPRAAGAPPVPRGPVCGLGGGSAGPICGRAVTLAQFAQGLAGVYQRTVVDMTGLAGRFDVDLSFTPDHPNGPGIAFGNACPGGRTLDGPALSTAMREQLGLRVRAGEAPVEMLVIDSVERPSEN